MKYETVTEMRDEVFDLFNETIQMGSGYVTGAAGRCIYEYQPTLDDPVMVAEHIVFWVSVSLLQMEYGVIDDLTLQDTQEMLKKYCVDSLNIIETEKEELDEMIKEFQEKLPTVKIVSSDEEIPPKEETKHLWGRPFKVSWRKNKRYV